MSFCNSDDIAINVRLKKLVFFRVRYKERNANLKKI